MYHGQSYAFELWWDLSKETDQAQLQQSGMVEYLDLDNLTTDTSKWTVTGATDGKAVDKSLYTITTGKKITDSKDPNYGKTPITIQFNATKTVKNTKGDEVKIIDTSKVKMGQYYKVDFSVTVKDNVKSGYEIKNVAKQTQTDIDGNTFNQNTETRENQVIVPTIKTKAHTDNGDQVIDQNESKAYDKVDLTNIETGEQGVAYLHRVVRDSSGKVVSDNIVSTVNFAIDDAVAKAKETQVETNVDKSKDSSLPAGQTVKYVWGESLYLKGANTTTATPIAKYYDQNDKDESLSVAQPSTPPTSPNLPNIVNKVAELYLPKTGATAGTALIWAGTFTVIGSLTLVGVRAYRRKKGNLEPLDLDKK